MDRLSPLISDSFLAQAEARIRKMGELEAALAETADPAEKERLQAEYAAVSQDLQELIDPSSADDGEEEADDE